MNHTIFYYDLINSNSVTIIYNMIDLKLDIEIEYIYI